MQTGLGKHWRGPATRVRLDAFDQSLALTATALRIDDQLLDAVAGEEIEPTRA